jgi:hypothetical protein
MIVRAFMTASSVVHCVAALLLRSALADEALRLTVEGAPCSNLFRAVTHLRLMSHDSLQGA